MKNEVKVIELSTSQNNVQDLENAINEWLKQGWTFKQMTNFANKVYVVLEKTIAR